MRFVHISDTHLGYSQYGLSERKKDFFDAFSEAVDFAINNRVDFIIHSGDFFHTSRPSNQTFLEGIELLKRLKDANIPMFVISGNHDRGSQVKDISPLSILEPVGLKVVDTGFTEHEGVFIGGLKYISKAGLKQIKSIRNILEKYLENLKDGFKILMLHQEFSPFFPSSELYMDREIPEGFDYVGIGHYHVKQEPKIINGATVVYPGSTEFTAYNQRESEVEKGFYSVEVSGKSIKCDFIPLKSGRPFINVDFVEENLDNILNSLKQKVEKLIDEGKKKPVVIFKGSLKNLDLNDLISILEKQGLTEERCLHFRFNLSKEIQEREFVLQEGNERDFIGEELKKLIEDEDILNVVKEAISTLQTFETPDEMKKFLKENPDILSF